MRTVRCLAVAVCALVATTACSDRSSDAAVTDRPSSTTTTIVRPPGPAASLTELTGGGKAFMGSATAAPIESSGYTESEYAASGTATSYRSAGPLAGDGRWTFAPDGSAPYRTRVLVRRPARAQDFSGTVVVEWLNVSGGLDADPDWASMSEEIIRRGDAWVGVSAQLIGVQGGPVLVTAPGVAGVVGKGLKALDPARYGTLEHPGDGFSFDIYTQVARAARAGDLLGGSRPEQVLAVGESQSAIALTTYYDGVQPLTEAFDGFLVHSRASVALPLVGPGRYADLAGSIGRDVVRFRTDLSAPVLDLQSEGDVTGVLDSAAARQPDGDHFRLWEVAGTSHADAHLLGPIAASADCGAPVNAGPLHVVAKAALHALDRWVRTGTPPPAAPRLELTGGATPAVRRDADGIAVGGVRTPPVDVPVVVLSGTPGPSTDLFCLLLGSTTPLPAQRLAALYPSRTEYQQRYGAAVDRAVDRGVVLAADRDALLSFSDPSRVQG